MFAAQDKDGKLIDIEDAIKLDKREYFCPCCKGEVFIRNGVSNASHFAHKNSNDCDTFSQDMSEWHREWQKRFPLKNREVGLPFNNPIHRADVLAYGFVLEFQHSRISREEFNLRNEFYTSLGKKVIWIFDMREVVDAGRMEFHKDWEYGGQYTWKNSWRIFEDWCPVRDKDIKVFFQMTNYDFNDEFEIGFLEQVVWAINEDDFTDMKVFRTSYSIGDLTRLKSYMKKQYELNNNYKISF